MKHQFSLFMIAGAALFLIGCTHNVKMQSSHWNHDLNRPVATSPKKPESDMDWFDRAIDKAATFAVSKATGGIF